MSGILMDLSLPSADTVVHNSRILFANQCVICPVTKYSNGLMLQKSYKVLVYSTFIYLFVCFYVYLYVSLWT